MKRSPYSNTINPTSDGTVLRIAVPASDSTGCVLEPYLGASVAQIDAVAEIARSQNPMAPNRIPAKGHAERSGGIRGGPGRRRSDVAPVPVAKARQIAESTISSQLPRNTSATAASG